MTMPFAPRRHLAALVLAITGASALHAQTVPDPLTCLLIPAHSSDIGSDRGGIVADVPVKRADYVQQGQVLVQLDDSLARADLELAQINRDALGAKLDRSAALVDSKIISRDEIEKMRTDFAIAKAQADRAALQVSRAQVLAPYAGYISKVYVQDGELIGTQPLVRLIDIRTLKAELVFTSEAYGKIAIGDTLPIGVNLVNKVVDAKVTVVDPFLDASSNTFTITAEIDNADQTLPAGASCRIAQ